MRSDSIYNRHPSDQWQQGRKLLPWGHFLRWSGTRTGGPSLATVIEALPDRWIVQSELTDESGASPDQSGLGELVSISYRIPETQRQGSFRLLTRFSRFQGNRHIIFSNERESAEQISNPRELLLTPQAFEIEQITIQRQVYARRWASLFGLFPVSILQAQSVWRSDGTISFSIAIQRQNTREETEKQSWVEWFELKGLG